MTPARVETRAFPEEIPIWYDFLCRSWTRLFGCTARRLEKKITEKYFMYQTILPSLRRLLHYSLPLVLIMYSLSYPVPLPLLFFLFAFHSLLFPNPTPIPCNRYKITMKLSFLFFGLMPCLKLIPLIMRPRLRMRREHEIYWQGQSLYLKIKANKEWRGAQHNSSCLNLWCLFVRLMKRCLMQLVYILQQLQGYSAEHFDLILKYIYMNTKHVSPSMDIIGEPVNLHTSFLALLLLTFHSAV